MLHICYASCSWNCTCAAVGRLNTNAGASGLRDDKLRTRCLLNVAQNDSNTLRVPGMSEVLSGPLAHSIASHSVAHSMASTFELIGVSLCLLTTCPRKVSWSMAHTHLSFSSSPALERHCRTFSEFLSCSLTVLPHAMMSSM